MAEPGGLSSEDLRKQASISAIRRNSGTAVMDPMDEAMSIARKKAAIGALNSISASSDNDVVQAETARVQAETARLQAQIDRQKLQEEITSARSESKDEWQQFLMGEVGSLREQLAGMQQAQNEAAMEALRERQAMLQDELARVREQPSVSPMAMVREHLQEARALVELTSPPSKDVPPPAIDHTSLELRAWEKRVEIDQERWRAEREDRHRERMAEIEAEARLKASQLELDKDRLERVDRALNTTLPRVIDLGQQFLEKFMSPGTAAPAAENVSAAAYAVPGNAPQVPAGATLSACQVQGCGYPIVYRKEWASVNCPSCGAQYKLSPDEPDQETKTEQPAASAGYGWEQQAPVSGAIEEVAAPTNAPFV